VTTKAKVAVAAVLVLGAAVTWRTLDTSPPSGSQAVATTHAPADPAATNRPAPAHDASPAISREVQPARAPATLATSPTASACVLRVRVVDPAGEPCTEGRIFGFASETTGSTFPPLRSFDQAIAGEVTTLEFPRATRRLLIAASVHGRRPSHRQGASWPDGLWESPAPRIERDLTIEVDRPLEGATLAGRVLVDGALRTPRGLAIDPTDWATAEDLERDAELYVRIHALDAAYELGPRPSRAFKLWVTSDETVPRLLPIAADLATLDLELSTARTLELTVLDRKSGEPIPDLELHVALNVPVERPSLFRQVWRDHARFVVTDERGIATVTGIPPEGQLDVRRDASASTEKMRVGDQVFQTPRLREPLLELRLESKLPEVIQRTIRVDREDRRPTIHGRVAAVLLESKLVDEPALEVRWARVNEGERADLHDEFVPIDASGEFALTVDAHHEYRIWAEREGIRFSQTAAVTVATDDPEPVELVPRRCDEVLLRLVRCPSEGFVHLFVPDAESVIPRGIVFPVKGGIVERRLALDGPATISVGWQLSRGGESGKVRSIDVNPASMPVVEVDLQGDQTREVRLDLGGVAAPAQSQLVLKAAHELTTSGSMISLRFEGTKGVAPIVVDPGRYLAILAGLPGLAVEEITIPEGPRGAPLTIAFQLKEHPRAELGAGVELTRVGTIELDANFRKALTLRFARRTELAALDTIWLPANCAFTVLPE